MGFDYSRSPHGERGLKYHLFDDEAHPQSRSPHGERGLKSVPAAEHEGPEPSLPTRGAWIEMPNVYGHTLTSSGRSPHGERGLK